jgi:hypothetical protein
MRRLKTIKIDGFPVSELKELPPPPPLWRSLFGAKLGVAALIAAVYLYYVATMVQQMRTAMANPLSRLDVSPVYSIMSPGLYFCVQNNVGSLSEQARLTFDATYGCQVMRSGVFTGRKCPFSYSNLTITQVNYRMYNCGIIDPVLLTGGLDIDSDLVNVRYSITRDPAQAASSAGGLLFSGTFKARGANGEPIVDKLDLSQDYGVTLFRFRRTDVISAEGSLSDYRYEISVSNTPQCALCSVLGPTHGNMFILPLAWEITTQTRYISFGPLDLIGAITGVAGIMISIFFRCMGTGAYQDDGICQWFFPSCMHRLFYQQQAAKQLTSAYFAGDDDDSGATEASVIPHKDDDGDDKVQGSGNRGGDLGDHADCAQLLLTSSALLSPPPHFKNVPPAVQACIQSYHEQLAVHLASMRSVQKRMLTDIGRLVAESADINAVDSAIELQQVSQSQESDGAPLSLQQKQRQPYSSYEGNLPRRLNLHRASDASSNLPATIFSPGHSDDPRTQSPLFSPGGKGHDATALRGLVQSTPSMNGLPPALDQHIESSIDRPALDVEEMAVGPRTRQDRIKHFLMRFKTHAIGEDEMQ